MGMFNFFRRKDQGNPDTSKDKVNGNYPGLENQSQTSLNGQKGLDAIYAFLQYDYESKGYNDAITNPDESYKADNIKLFRHDLSILIDRSATYYEGLLKETDFHISSRSRAGLIDLVEELKTRKEVIVDHLQKVKMIKQETMNGGGDTDRIALSYQRGFMRGLSAISQSKIFNRNI